MADLRTDYKDDVLDTTVNERRKYQMITNEDGTISLVDVTEYSQVGDSFGALDVNTITEEVNQQNSKMTDMITLDYDNMTDHIYNSGANPTINIPITQRSIVYVTLSVTYNGAHTRVWISRVGTTDNLSTLGLFKSGYDQQVSSTLYFNSGDTMRMVVTGTLSSYSNIQVNVVPFKA